MNQYEVFRVDKVKTAGITNVQNHNQQKEEHADFLASRNDNFNKEHLHLNRHLVYSDGFRSDINKILKEHGITKTRKDAVKMLDAIVSYSPEMTKHLCCYLNQNNEAWLKVKEHQKWMEEYNSIPEDERNELINSEKAWADDYFDRALEWYQENYGYVISAEVHYTESTPHLHIDSIPLKYDAEKDSYKLSAKEVVGNSKKLSEMQTKFHEEVGQISGLDRGIEKQPGESYKRRKTKHYWEVEQAKAEAEEAQQKAVEAENRATEARKDTETEEKRQKVLKSQNQALEDWQEDTCAEIDSTNNMVFEILQEFGQTIEPPVPLKELLNQQKETTNAEVTAEEVNKGLQYVMHAERIIKKRAQLVIKIRDELIPKAKELWDKVLNILSKHKEKSLISRTINQQVYENAQEFEKAINESGRKDLEKMKTKELQQFANALETWNFKTQKIVEENAIDLDDDYGR